MRRPAHRHLDEFIENDRDTLRGDARGYIEGVPYGELNVPRVSYHRTAPEIGYAFQGTPAEIGRYFGSARSLRRKPVFDSERSARQYLAKKGIRNHSVVLQDLDADGIDDVVVLNPQRTPVAVNGYILSDSDFPYRRDLADYKARVPHSTKMDYLIDTYRPQFDPEQRRLVYQNREAYERDLERPGIRRHLPKQSASLLFYHKIFSPVYNGVMRGDTVLRRAIPALVTSNQLFKALVTDPIGEAMLANEGFRNAFTEKVTNSGKPETRDNIIKAMRASKEYRAYVKSRLMDDTASTQYQERIENFLRARINEVEPYVGDGRVRNEQMAAEDEVNARYAHYNDGAELLA